MTPEEKARAYDEALDRARKLYNEEETSGDVEIACEIIFPELLKEFEDEKIRKALLNYLKKMWGNCKDNVCGVHVEDAIAWLEKQGKEPVWTDNDRTMAFTLLRDVDQMTHISNEGKNERLEWLSALENRFKED